MIISPASLPATIARVSFFHRIARGITIAVVALCLSVPQGSDASVSDSAGFGGRSAALGGATVADGSEGYQSFSNPAGLATYDSKTLYTSYGIIFLQPRFKAINGVLVQNYFVADQNTTGNVDVDYEAQLGHLLGAKYHFFSDHRLWNPSVGVTGFLPLQHFAYLNTGEAFIPEYLLYRSRTQRPQMEAGLGFSPMDGLAFGAGLHLGFNLRSKAVIFLQNNTQLPSSMRFESRITPTLSPYFGIQVNEAGVADARERNWSIGMTVRLPQVSKNEMDLVSTAAALGSNTAITIRAEAESALLYDPLTIELGGSLKILPSVRLNAQVDYQNWTPVQYPMINLSQVDASQGDDPESRVTVPISATANPSPPAVAIIIPRGGFEVDVTSSWTVRAGYFYRPSIFKSLPTGTGNLLDPPRHAISAGVGTKGDSLLGKEIPWHVDFALSVQPLVTQTITKTAGDELDRTSLSRGGSDIATGKIGSPGYTAGGLIWGGVVSMSLDL